jgi:hypothetical protein
MRARFRVCALALLIVTLVSAAGCSDESGSPAAPLPVAGAGASVTAEPLSIRPEVLSQFPCPGQPAFGLGVTIVVTSHDRNVVLQSLRFALTDPSGAVEVPDVFPALLPVSSPSARTFPIPGEALLPGSPPVGVPGSSPVRNVTIASGSPRSLPFFLRFACGIVPGGTLLVTAETTDARGAIRTSDVRIAVTP